MPLAREARERYDPRLYENFELLYDEMTRRTGMAARYEGLELSALESPLALAWDKSAA